MRKNELGDFIKKLRIEKKISQEELAGSLFFTRQALSKWETGKSLPTGEAIASLSEYFNIPIEEFLEKTDIVDIKELKYKLKEIEEKRKIDKKGYYFLNLYDEERNKKKRSKMLFERCIYAFIFAILLFIILRIYTGVKVYYVGGESDNISIQNSFLMLSRSKYFFDLGTITNKGNNKINSFEIYYYNGEGNKTRVTYIDEYDYSKETSNFILTDHRGYNAYFNYKDLDEILRTLMIEFTFDDGSTEIVELEFTSEKINKIFNDTREPMVRASDESSKEELTNELFEFIKNNFEPQDDGWVYRIKEKERTIECLLLEPSIIITVKEGKVKEIYDYTVLYNYRDIVYKLYLNEKEKNDTVVTINSISSEIEQKIYDDFRSYLKKCVSKFDEKYANNLDI